MESRFGHDFSKVRVHDDAQAAGSAKAIGARAYTSGNQMAFGVGEFQPGTKSGKRLLAHELTHVVQQRRGISTKLEIAPSSGSHEREADRVADSVMEGRTAPLASPPERSSSPSGTLQRAPNDSPAQDIPSEEAPLEEVPAPSPDSPAPVAQQQSPPPKGGGKAQKAKRRDVVLLMDAFFMPAAKLFAPGVKPTAIDSPETMATTLKAINFPVGRLFVLAHSTPQGHLKFDSTGFLPPDKIAGHLSGTINPSFAPEHLDFRGCSIGTSPAGMEKMRGAVGAGSAVGSTCFMVIKWVPLKLGFEKKKEITQWSQLKAAGFKAAFDTHFKELPKQFGDAKKCIVNNTKKGFFRAGGRLVTIFVNPTASDQFSKKNSVCFKDLSTTTTTPAKAAAGGAPKGAGHCQLVKIEVPAPSAGSSPGTGQVVPTPTGTSPTDAATETPSETSAEVPEPANPEVEDPER